VLLGHLQIGFHQCKTDPCLWVLHERYQGDDLHDCQAEGNRRTVGYICAHVDDFLISGDETSEQWADA